MNMEFFNEIESKYDLLNSNLKGYFFWNYLRVELADRYTLVQEKLNNNQTHKKKSFINKSLEKLLKYVIPF